MSVLQLFKPLTVVHQVCRADALPEGAITSPRDTITLGWEDRLKTRARRRSDNGVEFATALPRATVLRQDDCFVLGSVVVVVVERPEPVLVITPRTTEEWGLFAYQLGNHHQPLMIGAATLVCLDAPGVRQVLEYQAIPYTTAEQPFTPLGLNVEHEHS